jgi:aminoglycoside phosphotransferase (APT) family kinase protein
MNLGRVIDDPVLPAAAHLTGPFASDVVGTAVAAGGSELVECQPVHVHYRPGSDLIVRYRATVRRPDDTLAHETLLAGTTRHGPHPGTLPVEAITDADEPLVAGVWRWPFDPVLADLERIVTPARAARTLADVARGPLDVTVVVYRPAERVVVRIVDADGRELYVKLVAPHAVTPLAERHRALRDAGLPVPAVIAEGDTWIAMEALQGPTWRQVVKSGDGPWPTPDAVTELCDRIGAAELGHARPVRPRVLDAAAHARMLAAVAATQRDRLHRIAERFDREAELAAARCGTIVHGDLHEGQLILGDDGAITGLLDVDDVGPGDPVDDVANVIGHLHFRAGTSGALDTRLARYADDLRSRAMERHDPYAVDAATAGVLVGLATGPFRLQQPDWERSVAGVLDLVDATLPPLHARTDGRTR